MRSTGTSKLRRRGSSRRTLRGLRSSTGPSTTSSTAFAPSLSRSPRTCPRPLRYSRGPASARRSLWDGVAYGRTGDVGGIEAAAPLFPRIDAPTRRGVIDTHAHLDACEEPATTLVERARAAGVSRIITIGTGIESCRAALQIAERARRRRCCPRRRPAPRGRTGCAAAGRAARAARPSACRCRRRDRPRQPSPAGIACRAASPL